MKITNIYQAKTQLSKLIEMAINGEEVIISKSGKPMVKLVAIKKQSKPRTPGRWKNKVTISDDFDELPPEILSSFSGDYE